MPDDTPPLNIPTDTAATQSLDGQHATTITVTLAEVPTDVLASLVDDGPAESDQLMARLDGRAEDPRDAPALIGNALRLLVEGGWAEHDPTNPWQYRATDAGAAAIKVARHEQVLDLWEDDTDAVTAIQIALGAASVCWENPGGAGVFDSVRCGLIADRLVEHLRTLRLLPDPS